jgi:uncharacterized protein YdeI (YjbR/CyaY-like superfamily)
MVHYFDGPAAWRRLQRRHESQEEVWVGFHKRATKKPSLTWPQSVDEALCFGWIDGVRHRVDDERYTIRFTPRRPTSKWSNINVARVGALRREGRMTEAGERAFAARKTTGVYSYEQRKQLSLPASFLTRFRRKKDAWSWFSTQAPWYRRTCILWVVSAKKVETQERRLQTLIADSSAGRRIKLLARAT